MEGIIEKKEKTYRKDFSMLDGARVLVLVDGGGWRRLAAAGGGWRWLAAVSAALG